MTASDRDPIMSTPERLWTARAVTAALRVPWMRPWLLRRLTDYYVAAGASHAALARELQVSDRTVRRWVAADGELRDRLRTARLQLLYMRSVFGQKGGTRGR